MQCTLVARTSTVPVAERRVGECDYVVPQKGRYERTGRPAKRDSADRYRVSPPRPAGPPVG